MLTKEKLEEDLKNAIRSSDDVRKRTLRMVLTAIKITEVERREPLDEPALLSVMQKEVKTRREAIEEAKRANREDLVVAAEDELAFLNSYLPQPLTPQELQNLASQAIEEVGASGAESMGKVMKVLMPRVQGRADGKAVSALVQELLSKR
ncbi:MAG TPA: GatB/YqeY domain-containing protein [Anaerolineae bacterium]|nr:GatB/YqeY domain-containing protein [Anaerolineae bacterium]